jgi:ParB/RepB/Spo0J family partition protein
MQITKIAIEKFVYSPTNPRKAMNEAALKHLGASIKDDGLIEPIIARKHPKNEGKVEVVCGERRVRGAKLAGVDSLDTIIRDLTDEQVRELQHIENIQREDVTPLDQAASFAELMKLDPKKWTIDALAAKFKVARRTVYATLQLAKLHKDLQKLLADQKIDAGHALLLAPLPTELQVAVAKNIGERIKRQGEPPSVREIKQTLAEQVLHDLSAVPFDKTDASLNPKMGPCTTCRYNTTVDPEAFPDQPKDRCMAPACFAKKLDVFTLRKAAELAKEAKAKKETIVTVSGSQPWQLPPDVKKTNTDRGVLMANQYREVKPNAKGATKAFVVNGEGRGTVKYISTEPVNGSGDETKRKPTAKEKAERAKLNLEQRANSEARRRVLAAIQQKAAKLTAPILRWIARHAIARSYDTKGVVKGLGWIASDKAAQMSKYTSGLTTAVVKRLDKLPPADLVGVTLYAMCFTDDPYQTHTFSENSLQPHVREVVKALGVDSAGIRREVLKGLQTSARATKPPAGKARKAAAKAKNGRKPKAA